MCKCMLHNNQGAAIKADTAHYTGSSTTGRNHHAGIYQEWMGIIVMSAIEPKDGQRSLGW